MVGVNDNGSSPLCSLINWKYYFVFVTALNSLALELDHSSACVYNTAGTACYWVASTF